MALQMYSNEQHYEISLRSEEKAKFLRRNFGMLKYLLLKLFQTTILVNVHHKCPIEEAVHCKLNHQSSYSQRHAYTSLSTILSIVSKGTQLAQLSSACINKNLKTLVQEWAWGRGYIHVHVGQLQTHSHSTIPRFISGERRQDQTD